MTDVEVYAAGGVVVDAEGRLLVVHRPRYDDWTFPKGKLDSGETLEECAIREVEEESGCVCRLGEAVATVHYVDHKGRSKQVVYWLMTPTSVEFEPNDEVDEIRWLEPDKVDEMLSYGRDLHVLESALESIERSARLD